MGRRLCILKLPGGKQVGILDRHTVRGIWPIKCRQGYKTNKLICQFWVKTTFDWFVNNPSYDVCRDHSNVTRWEKIRVKIMSHAASYQA
jgi:hypothetical protein